MRTAPPNAEVKFVTLPFESICRTKLLLYSAMKSLLDAGEKSVPRGRLNRAESGNASLMNPLVVLAPAIVETTPEGEIMRTA
jgi:hypothetical protein